METFSYKKERDRSGFKIAVMETLDHLREKEIEKQRGSDQPGGIDLMNQMLASGDLPLNLYMKMYPAIKDLNAEHGISFDGSFVELKEGATVFDKQANTNVMVEKIDTSARTIVLDRNFGKITIRLRDEYIQEFGNDGRYSVSIEEAIDRLVPVMKEPAEQNWQDEIKKCQASPYYYATTYLKVNGMPFTTLLSEEEFNKMFNRFTQNHRNPY